MTPEQTTAYEIGYNTGQRHMLQAMLRSDAMCMETKREIAEHWLSMHRFAPRIALTNPQTFLNKQHESEAE